jgi:molybdenum cofactor cytidylyltransferase
MEMRGRDPEPTGILLAAGNASRFGGEKLLRPLPDGVPVGVAAAANLGRALRKRVAVVRQGDVALTARLRAMGLEVVVNPGAHMGMGTSIAVGVGAARQAAGWVIALADMPCINPVTIREVGSRLEAGASIVAPVYRGKRGHPVGFSNKWRVQLLGLSGDRGGQGLVATAGDEVQLFETDDPGVLLDVDVPEDMPRTATQCFLHGE